MSGYACPPYDRAVFRGDVAGREFIAFWLDGDNRVLAGMNVNVWDVLDDVKALITSRAAVAPKQLADPQSSKPARRRLNSRRPIACAAAGRCASTPG